MLPFFKRRIVLLFRRCDLPIQYGKITSRQVALLKPYGIRCRRFGYFSGWCEGEIFKLTRTEKTANIRMLGRSAEPTFNKSWSRV